MIVYDLGCSSGHRFEGWFGSLDLFERQRSAGELDCPVCGSHDVERLPTASHVSTRCAEPPREPSREEGPGLLARLIDHLRRNTEDVGSAFAETARKMHYEEIPRRSIRGVGTGQELAELREEGVEVFVLPQLPGPAGGGNLH